MIRVFRSLHQQLVLIIARYTERRLLLEIQNSNWQAVPCSWKILGELSYQGHVHKFEIKIFWCFLVFCSTNGTYLNSERLNKNTFEAKLRHGDIISIAFAPHHGRVDGNTISIICTLILECAVHISSFSWVFNFSPFLYAPAMQLYKLTCHYLEIIACKFCTLMLHTWFTFS